jgi:hypothetical protein
MTRITILTKLRFAAALAPLLMVVAVPMLVMSFIMFGAMPTVLNQNQLQAMRAANGMELAIYKMDWGRTQPDGMQIVQDQQRRFVSWVSVARDHVETRAQYDALGRIAKSADPIFTAMRKAEPGDESVEPGLVKLQGLISDLSNADDAVLEEIASRARTRANVMIAILAVACFLVPWGCFAIVARLCTRTHAALRDIRHRVDNLTESGGEPSGDLRAIDERMTELGFAKRNPMLAE